MPPGYAASSVLPYAKDLQGKLLVMHGMADDNVLFLHSTKLFRKLQDLGKPFDVMVYPGAKHGLTRQHDGRHAYKMVKRFFDENLQALTGPAQIQSAISLMPLAPSAHASLSASPRSIHGDGNCRAQRGTISPSEAAPRITRKSATAAICCFGLIDGRCT